MEYGAHGSYPMMIAITQAISIILLVEQSLPVDAGFTSQIERLGLTGSLIVAVGILWRTLAKKDDQLSDMTKQVVNALAVNSDTQKELRESQKTLCGIVEESSRSKEHLANAIETWRQNSSNGD